MVEIKTKRQSKNFMNEKRKAGRYVPAFYNKI